LNDAVPLLQDAGGMWRVRYQQQLGNLLLAAQRQADALAALDAAVTAASESKQPTAEAAALNDLGNALAMNGYTGDALSAYRRSGSLARANGLQQLALSGSINALRLQMRARDFTTARAMLAEAVPLLDPSPSSFEQALALISLAEVERQLDADDASRRSEWLQRAERFALEHQNHRLLSLAYGHQGADQLIRHDFRAAQELTRKALFFAAQTQANDLIYQWRWQLARLWRQEQRLVDAVEEFDRAIAALAPIRQELRSGYRDSGEFFRNEIRPVYVEFVDALLLSSDASSDIDRRQQMLNRARNVIEQLKSAELQDYFRDECVVEQQAQALPVDEVARDAAVLYPVVLPDRIELLLQLDGRLRKHTVTVEQSVVTDNALRLRELAQDPSSTRFLPYAQRLYRWLIAPVKAQLDAANARTLVVIPDGVLRVVPLAVLHDGDSYLLADYALAITPSLTLTAPQPLADARPQVLLAGVSQPVQGFAPLPSVSQELATIRSHVGGRVLVDGDYTTNKVTAALTQDEYAIVHMATHTVIGDTPTDSFLLTYDGKLTMSDLERLLRTGRFRKQPVELLTLSACETAVGDERTALGLAGIAVKSGARSAVATLWRVSDDSAALLMNRFYEQLSLRGDQQVSKANALRAAQRSLLNDPDTAHPAHWAAFMLIGNWL
jgi:CHAT domain-containing protein